MPAATTPPAAAMAPHGAALRAYQAGQRTAELLCVREDGLEARIPVAYFFREPQAFTPLERTALERCRGHVLDVGAGAGQHSLALQASGLQVTALDICGDAVEVMRERGVRDARLGDIFEFTGGPFDTLILLDHAVGMVGDIEGLRRFLAAMPKLLARGGRLLLDSVDVTWTSEPVHLRYLEANRAAGRYPGETRIHFEFGGLRGAECGWLHVDAITLRRYARLAGWQCETLSQEPTGEYVAALTRD